MSLLQRVFGRIFYPVVVGRGQFVIRPLTDIKSKLTYSTIDENMSTSSIDYQVEHDEVKKEFFINIGDDR